MNISANLGVNGIGYSNIIVNIILFAVSVVLLSKEGYKIFNKEKLSFTWAKEFVKLAVFQVWNLCKKYCLYAYDKPYG